MHLRAKRLALRGRCLKAITIAAKDANRGALAGILEGERTADSARCSGNNDA